MSKNVNIVITGDSKSAQKALKDTAQSAEQLNDKVSESIYHSRSMKRALGDAGVGAGALTSRLGPLGVALGVVAGNAISAGLSAISSRLGDAVARLDTLQNFPIVMQSLGFSTESASKSIQMLSEGTLGLPTALNEIVASTQQLATVIPSLEGASASALAFNNAMLASGAGTQQVNGAMTQLTQMLATGTVDFMSWRSIAQTMPGQLKQISQTMLGASASQYDLYNALKEGKVSMSDFLQTVVNLDQQGGNGFASFRDQAFGATGGIATSMANLQNAITRGLANVMDAIGRSNIAQFFATITAWINTAFVWVTAFTQALVGLFGVAGNASSKTAKDSQTIADSLNSAGASAGNISAGVGGAAKEAKKLADILAPFDKVNVLKQPDSGSSGGGAGGGGGGITAPKIDVGDTEVTAGKSRVQEALEKIKGFFKAFADNPFVKGFIQFWKDIASIVSKGWDKLKELKIPQAVGDFFKMVGDFFGKVMENKVVATIIEKLGFALGYLAGAISLVVGAMLIWNVITAIWTGITIVATAVGTAFGAVMAFITSPIVLIVLAIAAVIAIIVLLIKHFDKVKEVAGAVWEWIKNAWGVVADWFNDKVVEPVKGFFQNLWDWFKKNWPLLLAILTGPFGLAVLAIVKNWDKIKETASKLWEGIKEVFSKVKSWFGDVFNGAWEAVKKAFSFYKSFFQGIWNGIVDIFGKVGTAVGNAIGGAFKSVVNGVINIVSGVVNTVIDLINGAINLINKLPGVSIGKIGRLSLPKMAKGGVVNGATIAMIGEQGAEAVVPLENNTGWTEKVANLLNNSMGGKGTVIENVIELNGTEVGRAMVEILNERTNATGFNGLTL